MPDDEERHGCGVAVLAYTLVSFPVAKKFECGHGAQAECGSSKRRNDGVIP